MKRLFTDAQAKKIRQLHHEGMTVAELIRRFMPHTSSHNTTPMMNLLKGITYQDAGGKLGIVRRKNRKPRVTLTQTQKDEIIALHDSGNGISQGELSRRYSVSHSYINRIVNGSR